MCLQPLLGVINVVDMKSKVGRKKRFTGVRLDPEIYDTIENMALSEGRSVSYMVNLGLRTALNMGSPAFFSPTWKSQTALPRTREDVFKGGPRTKA